MPRHLRSVPGAALLALVLAFFVAPAGATDSPYRHVAAATALVEITKGLGSCVCIRSVAGHHWFLTCEHVARGEHQVQLTFGVHGPRVPARVVDVDAARDLGLLEYSDGPDVPVVELASQPPDVGDPVFSVGAPGGFAHFTSYGHVADDARVVFSGGPELLTLAMPVIPGMSGSGLVDAQGHLVGIVEAHMPGTDIGFAISLRLVREFLHW